MERPGSSKYVMSNTSVACKNAQEDAHAEGGSGDVRMSSIACGLNRVLKHDVLKPHFANYASLIGTMRHVPMCA